MLGAKLIEEELLESCIEEGDLNKESEHLEQGCADPRVIEFPRDARGARYGLETPRALCASWHFACFGESAGRIVAGYSCCLSCSVGHNRQHIVIDTPFPWFVTALFRMPLHLAAASRRHVRCL